MCQTANYKLVRDSDTATHEHTECVVRITDRERAASSIRSHMRRLARGSSPEDDSSMSNTLGSPINANPSESFRLFPPEYALVTLSACGVRVRRPKRSCTRASTSLEGMPRSFANMVSVSRPVIKSRRLCEGKKTMSKNRR